MNTENKSTELDNTGLHISDVSDSFFKTNFDNIVDCSNEGYILYFKKYKEYELTVKKYDDRFDVGFIQGDMMEINLGEYSLYDLLIIMKVLK
jgi:hypothetical protein